MARYENEKWPKPDPTKEEDTRVFDDESPVGSGGEGSGGGGGAGSGNYTVVPRPERKPRPGKTPIIERRKFHHHRHGTGGQETDVERDKVKTDNMGFGCVPKPKVSESAKTIVIMEPEPLMRGKDPFFQVSFGMYALQKQLRDEGLKYASDAKTGVTSFINIDREKAEGLCREHSLKSMLFIEIGENRDWFHSIHLSCSKYGKIRKIREYRLVGLEKENVFERIESQLLMKFPDLSTLGVDMK